MTPTRREALQQTIPEFDDIEDADLQSRTLDVWEEALDESGLAVSDLSDIPASLNLPTDEVSFVDHVRSVTAVATAGVETYLRFHPPSLSNVDRDYVIAGALLHDVGKLLEYEWTGDELRKSSLGKFVRHPVIAAAMCMDHGLPDEVTHVVAVHSHEGEGYDRSPEALILYHADFLIFDAAVSAG